MKISEETYKLNSGLLLVITSFKGTPLRHYKIIDTSDQSIIWSLHADIVAPLEEFQVEKVKSDTLDA